MSSKNKNLNSIIIVGLVVIIGAITNPDLNAHKSKVKSLLYELSQYNLADEFLESGNEWERAGSALGMSLGMSLIEKMVDNMVQIDNYVVFSITKIKYDGNKRVVGYGIFGNVFILDDVKRNFYEQQLDKSNDW